MVAPNGSPVPRAVNTRCPYCGEKVSFTLQDVNFDQMRRTLAATMRCPDCQKDSYFWGICPRDATDDNPSQFEQMVMYPEQQAARSAIQGSELVPDRVRAAYIQTLQAFNYGLWGPGATCCRRTLEGILKDVVPSEDNRRATLAAQIRSIANLEKDVLTRPIINLSDAIREGGNIGAHFDDERDADRETVGAMIDLIEYLLEYVYTLPAMTERLKERLSSEPNPPG